MSISNRTAHRVGSNKGFTLVELLVVVGIIALLISILLPTLGRARRSAMNVKCLANLHSLGQITILYAGSNRGWLPYRAVNAAPPSMPQPLEAFCANGDEDEPGKKPGANADMRMLFLPYLKGWDIRTPNKVFYCPARDGSDSLIRYGAQCWPATPANAGAAYGANLYLIGYAYFGGLQDQVDVITPSHLQPTGGRMGWVSQTVLNPPTRMGSGTKGNPAIWTDLTESKARMAGRLWYYISHSKNGSVDLATDASKPREITMNAVLVDGSARTYAYNDDPTRSELEPAVQSAWSNPGFYWPKAAGGVAIGR